MSQQQLSRFVSPVTQSLDDMQTQLSYLSATYRDVNTKLQSHVNNLLGGTQGFQGSGANAFSGLVYYYIGTMEHYCQALDSGANATGNCSAQISNAVDSASAKNLDTTIVTYVLSHVTLDEIILQGGSAINPLLQDLQNTCNQMQNTWNDLQKTLAHEDKLMNDANNAANQEWTDLSSFDFGKLGGDIGRYWSDQWQKLNDWVHEAGDYVQLAGEGLHIAWDGIQLTWQVLVQWADDIFHAVKNCLAFISSIVTTATQDIGAFMSKLGPIIQEVFSDTHTALLDEEKGDDLGALAALVDMLLNAELMQEGLQPLSQSQKQIIKEIIEEKASSWLQKILQKLPLWAKIAIIVLLVAGLLAGLAYWTRIDPQSSVPSAIKKLRNLSEKQWDKSEGKDRKNTNWGGGQMDIVGKKERALDKDGNPIMVTPKYSGESGLLFSPNPNPLYKGKHVEEQTIDWALNEIENFRKKHGNAPLVSLNLDIYTFKAPCGPDYNNCAANLGPNGKWEKAIKKAAGTNDVKITVYTSNGNVGSVPIQKWP